MQCGHVHPNQHRKHDGRLCKGGPASDNAGMTLDEVRTNAFHRLSHGVSDRHSAFRTPALGTLGPDQQPRLRTVVLRAFDPAARRITLHSDARASKIKEIGSDPRVAVHVWDENSQVQVRLRGEAAVAAGDRAAAEWAGLHPGSRATYGVSLVPGTVLDDPSDADRERLSEADAFANFAVIDVVVTRLEWLHLAPGGHRRAVFTWAGEAWNQTWVVP